MRLGKVFGIEITVDASWVVIAVLVAWSFWGRFTTLGEESTGVALVMAAVAAGLFFGSVLAHELAHSLEARHRGVEVHGITLFLFGGATRTSFDVRRPGDELALTAVGPLTSFVLAAGFGLVATAAASVELDQVAAVAGLLGWLNLALGVFNLLPGAPLDGGRILRAVVWGVTGNRQRAIRVAARAGQLLGGLIVAFGILQILTVPGAFVGGLWFAFIGWFLLRAAGLELMQEQVRHQLEDVPVRRLVSRIPAVPARATVQEAVEGWFEVHDDDVFPVEEDSETVGVVGVDEVRSVRRPDRDSVRVGEVMRPAGDLTALAAGGPAADAVDQLLGQPVAAAVEDGRVIGVVTARNVAGYLQRTRRLEEARR